MSQKANKKSWFRFMRWTHFQLNQQFAGTKFNAARIRVHNCSNFPWNRYFNNSVHSPLSSINYYEKYRLYGFMRRALRHLFFAEIESRILEVVWQIIARLMIPHFLRLTKKHKWWWEVGNLKWIIFASGERRPKRNL